MTSSWKMINKVDYDGAAPADDQHHYHHHHNHHHHHHHHLYHHHHHHHHHYVYFHDLVKELWNTGFFSTRSVLWLALPWFATDRLCPYRALFYWHHDIHATVRESVMYLYIRIEWAKLIHNVNILWNDYEITTTRNSRTHFIGYILLFKLNIRSWPNSNHPNDMYFDTISIDTYLIEFPRSSRYLHSLIKKKECSGITTYLMMYTHCFVFSFYVMSTSGSRLNCPIVCFRPATGVIMSGIYFKEQNGLYFYMYLPMYSFI